MADLLKCCRCGNYRATGTAEIEGSTACAPCAREHLARPARPIDTRWIATVSFAFLALLVALASASCEPAVALEPIPTPTEPETPAGMVRTTDGTLTYAPGGAVR